jgi:hypothetical protein
MGLEIQFSRETNFCILTEFLYYGVGYLYEELRVNLAEYSFNNFVDVVLQQLFNFKDRNGVDNFRLQLFKQLL